jgi:hypothetical protein
MKVKFLLALLGFVAAVVIVKHMYIAQKKSQSPMAKATRWLSESGK